MNCVRLRKFFCFVAVVLSIAFCATAYANNSAHPEQQKQGKKEKDDFRKTYWPIGEKIIKMSIGSTQLTDEMKEEMIFFVKKQEELIFLEGFTPKFVFEIIGLSNKLGEDEVKKAIAKKRAIEGFKYLEELELKGKADFKVYGINGVKINIPGIIIRCYQHKDQYPISNKDVFKAIKGLMKNQNSILEEQFYLSKNLEETLKAMMLQQKKIFENVSGEEGKKKYETLQTSLAEMTKIQAERDQQLMSKLEDFSSDSEKSFGRILQAVKPLEKISSFFDLKRVILLSVMLICLILLGFICFVGISYLLQSKNSKEIVSSVNRTIKGSSSQIAKDTSSQIKAEMKRQNEKTIQAIKKTAKRAYKPGPPVRQNLVLRDLYFEGSLWTVTLEKGEDDKGFFLKSPIQITIDGIPKNITFRDEKKAKEDTRRAFRLERFADEIRRNIENGKIQVQSAAKLSAENNGLKVIFDAYILYDKGDKSKKVKSYQIKGLEEFDSLLGGEKDISALSKKLHEFFCKACLYDQSDDGDEKYPEYAKYYEAIIAAQEKEFCKMVRI